MFEASAVLLPYQSDWIKDQAEVKVYEKSRRIGITWAEAADVALTASKRSGCDAWYTGYTKEMALEFIEDVADWARKFEKAASAIEETVIQDAKKDILAYRIRFASGHKVTALSSRPSNFRGKDGIAVIDEAAFHADLNQLLKAALAFLIWGGKVRVISTHNGVGNAFNDLINEVRSGKFDYSVHRTTFDEALAQGLYKKICAARGIAWTAGAEAAWREGIYKRYGDNADEELKCVPSTEGSAWLGYDLIISCEDKSAGEPKLYAGGPCVIGNDIGRRRDLWVAWVFEIVGDVLWTREIRELHKQTFAVQDATIGELFGKYKVSRLYMDQTGMGEKPVEDMKRLYPGRAEGILFTPMHRISMSGTLKRRFEDRKIRIPAENVALRADLHKPRMETSPLGVPHLVVERDEEGHADRFWAGCLGAAAADTGFVEPDIYMFGGDGEPSERDLMRQRGMLR